MEVNWIGHNGYVVFRLPRPVRAPDGWRVCEAEGVRGGVYRIAEPPRGTERLYHYLPWLPVRETREETCLIVEPTRIVGIYSRPQAAVVVIAYEADIVGGTRQATPESLEVRPFAVDDIPWDGLGFNTTLWAVRDWVRSVRPDLDVDALGEELVDR